MLGSELDCDPNPKENPEFEPSSFLSSLVVPKLEMDEPKLNEVAAAGGAGIEN